MGFIDNLRQRFEKKQSEARIIPGGTIMMISGCDDAQISSDVRNVSAFQLPDPAGHAGGACTSTLLSILYADHHRTNEDLSFVEVLLKMREKLQAKGYAQIPQLSSTTKIDVDRRFNLVPDKSAGTHRAVMIGINYSSNQSAALDGCHNDVSNMMGYIKDVHGFEDENITVLMDDGEHDEPTKANIVAAYKKVVALSEPGDAVFLHFSGHGVQVEDTNGDEDDGFDEALVPVDYNASGIILDDDLFEILIKPLKSDVCLTSVMDCCHSGTMLDLPYIYKANGEYDGMEIDDRYNFGRFARKLGGLFSDFFDSGDVAEQQ